MSVLIASIDHFDLVFSQLERQGEESTKILNVSMKNVSIGLKGGRVNPIKTMSLNLQTQNLAGFPNLK